MENRKPKNGENNENSEKSDPKTDRPFLELAVKGAGLTGWRLDEEKKEITALLSKNKEEKAAKDTRLYLPANAREEEWKINTKYCANPVLAGQFADPDIALFGDTYYLYATTDGFSGWSGTQFHVFSSKNLVDFEDEGIILDVAGEDVAWSVGSAWAPCIAERGGKYYFYFCAKDAAGDSHIGVAYANHPAGPFTAMKEPLITRKMCVERGIAMGQTIDPSVFTDEDGASYLLFGNGNAAVVRLREDMVSLDLGTLKNYEGAQEFREAITVTKRGGVYHFTWSCDDTGSPDYHVNYGTSKSIYGPITYHYAVLQKDEENGILGTGHHCILSIPGRDEYYIAYHRFYTPLKTFTQGLGFHREVCMDALHFDGQTGRMLPVKPTQEGIKARGNAVAAVSAKPGETEYSGYLFSYFVGNGPDQENVFFAASEDGFHWEALNKGEPVLTTELGTTGIRDPFLLRSAKGDRFFMIATDLCIAKDGDWEKAQRAGSQSIFIWESPDLVNWSKPRLVKVNSDAAGCTWAPEAFYDELTGEYMVFWASRVATDGYARQRIYYVRTRDFYNFTEPEVWIDYPFSVIDTTVIKDGDTYYRFTKYEDKSRIIMERADKLLGEWTEVESETLSAQQGVEGPCCFALHEKDQVDGNRFCLLLDHFVGSGYYMMVTKDLGTAEFKRKEGYRLPQKRPRHGTVIPVTRQEYERVIEHYNHIEKIKKT